MTTQNQFKVKDKAIANFGSGLTTPVTIIGGRLGSQYKVASRDIPQWVKNSKLSQVGEHTVLNYGGHKIIVSVLGTDGESSRIFPHLNNGYISEHLLTPAK